MSEPKFKVDLAAKKTEAGWLGALDHFWLAFTPKLFEWLGWVALLGAVRFVQTKNPNAWLGFLVALSTAAMFLYFMAFFYRFAFVGVPWLQSDRAHRLASIVISGTLAAFANTLASFAVTALSNVQP